MEETNLIRFPLLGATLVALAASASASATTTIDPAPRPDASVVVTASREAEPQFEALVPVVVIDRDAIERSLADDVAELLRFEAGIDVARSGGPGQQTSIFMRGTNSNHTVVLLDGVRINPGTKGNAALQNLAPELVDHIEIVKGPRSALYGTDAIGGVVNVITRHPEGAGLDSMLGYGRYDTRQGSIDGYYGDGRNALSAAINWLGSAGFPTQLGDPADRGFRDLSATLAGRTAIGGVELGARLWRASGHAQYADLFSTPPDQDQKFVDSAFAVELGGHLTERLHTRLVLSQAVDDLRQQVPLLFFGPLPEYDFATTRRNAADWQNSLDLGPQQLTFGGLLTREHTRSLVFGSGFDVDTRSDTWYAEDRVTLGRHHFTGALGYTRHHTVGDHATWNAEYGFALSPATLVTASWGTAFRAPDSTDLYGFGANPALRPETSRNIEVGLKHRLGAHQTVAFAAFDNRIDDLIQVVLRPTPTDPFAFTSENVDRARIRGIEASWDYVDRDWTARLEGSLQDPKDIGSGRRLLRRARSSATLSLARRLASQQLGVDVLASGNRSDIDNFGNRVRDGGYALVNLTWRATLGGGLSAQLRLENALDKRYQVVYSYYTPRRSVNGALRYAFR